MKFFNRIFSFGKRKLYAEAIQLYNKCMYLKATEKFRAIIYNKPNPNSLYFTLSTFYCGQAHRNLGEIFFATGDFRKASAEFEKSIDLTPNNVELYLYLGICYTNLDSASRAHDAFAKVMQQDPMCLPPKSKLSVVFHNLGIWDKAESTFKDILANKANYADIQYYLGVTYMGKGKAHLAVDAFEKALAINPKLTDAQIKLGITQAYLSNFNSALENLLSVIRIYPSHADIHFYIAIIYAAQNETQKSIDEFHQAIKINPSYKDARIKLGVLLCRTQNMEDGLKELEFALSIDPEDRALKTTLHSLKTLSQNRNVVLKDLPQYYSRLSGEDRIVCHEIGEFINYLIISPKFSDMLAILRMLPQNEEFFIEKLIPILKETLALHPEYSDIHNSLGTFYIKTGQFEKAIVSFQEARKINPRYLKARINLFNVLKQKGDIDEALKEGTEILKEKLPYPDFMCAVGEVYLSKKQYEDALNIVEKAIQKNPNFAPAHFLLAQIYNKMGNSGKVTETLRKCLDSDASQLEY